MCMRVGYRMATGHKGLKKSQSSKKALKKPDKGLTHMHEAPRSLGKIEDIGEIPGRVARGTRSCVAMWANLQKHGVGMDWTERLRNRRMSKGQVQWALSNSGDHAELWKKVGSLLLSLFLAQPCRHRNGQLQVGQPEEGLSINHKC